MEIVAGFALTAVANWTSRSPVTRCSLVGLWIAGRIAVSTSELIGPDAATIADLLFPVALTAVFAREVIAARNQREHSGGRREGRSRCDKPRVSCRSRHIRLREATCGRTLR